MRKWTVLAAALVLAACNKPAEQPAASQAAKPAEPAPGSREWKVANAMSAAPGAVANAATLMEWGSSPDSAPKQLRAGTNGWTCFADNPGSPGNDPMCFDGQFGKWATAWMGHKPVTITGLGVAYMLQGGSDASNTDPFKMKPDSGQRWVDSGPHVMIVIPNVRGLAGLPTDATNGGPWIMWQNTPYAHVMVPVAAAHTN
jgi:hypothetical protein